MRAARIAHTVLDLREPEEMAICALADSLWIPMGSVPEQIDSLPRAHPLVVLCHHGVRSGMVTALLREDGCDNARNLRGGIDAWARLVAPEMPRSDCIDLLWQVLMMQYLKGKEEFELECVSFSWKTTLLWQKPFAMHWHEQALR
ncbi:rhodanese-like domain-containing protein [Algihabitans albus]|uniref:rhodanese-like domain-containing protein n=1 Tax=Algihabitans albus TaxID=2164067 RepID=UPI001ABCE9A2|nr:rhodanese-like domain-containing protein [Algihabitans albus]